MKSTTTFRRVALGALLTIGLLVAPVAASVVPSSVQAGASSATHKAKLASNRGNAIEPKANGKFTCSSLYNSWTLSIKGVQVIGSDGVTPWDTTDNFGHYFVEVFIGAENFSVTLAQNSSTGLFDGYGSGVFSRGGECLANSGVQVVGGPNGGFTSLNLFATLS